MMLRSAQRLAMRAPRILRGGHGPPVHLTSESGWWSVWSVRQRYTILLKNQTDPTLADFFFDKWVDAWAGDVPSYNYWWVTSLAMGCMTGILSRHWFFNPDLYGRRQENKKPMPDRHRQYTYSLPYYNHRLRNVASTYRWCMIDNEPDWADNHPLGYRPNRKQTHRRPYAFCLTIPRYRIEDPLATSCSHENMERIYQEIGYTKKKGGEEEEE